MQQKINHTIHKDATKHDEVFSIRTTSGEADKLRLMKTVEERQQWLYDHFNSVEVSMYSNDCMYIIRCH